MFAFFSVYVNDALFKPDETIVTGVINLLIKHGVIKKELPAKVEWEKRLKMEGNMLLDMESTLEFKEFIDEVFSNDLSRKFDITMQVDEPEGFFEGRCFKLNTLFYILDICFQEDNIPSLDDLEIEFIQRYQGLLVDLARYLGKDIKIAICY